MKKCFIMFLLLTSILAITSCHKKQTVVQETEEEILLHFVTQNALPGAPDYEGWRAFAQKLEELSGSTMKIEFSTLTQFGTLEEMFNRTAEGKLDILSLGYTDMSYIIPELIIMGSAYVVRDYEHLLKILKSDYGKRINAEFEKLGVISSGVWYAGARQITSNKPINSLADFNGLRFRTPPTENIIAFVNAIGAKPISIAFVELYGAMEKNLADAQENPLPTIEVSKLYQVQKYILKTDHVIGTIATFINKEKYDSFTDEQKAWYDEAIEYGGQVCYRQAIELEANLLEKFEQEYNMIVSYPNKDELINAMKPYYDELEKEFGRGSVSSIMAIE